MTLTIDSITAADIDWTPSVAPTWPSHTDALEAAVELLPAVHDDIEADVIEALALALVETNERESATQAAHATILHQLHHAQRRVKHLERRLYDLLDAQREDGR